MHIEGVNFTLKDNIGGEKLESAHYALNEFQKAGVTFKGYSSFPWLVGTSPYKTSPNTQKQLLEAGQSVFMFIDTIQRLYKEGNAAVRDVLDLNTPPDLAGLQLDKNIVTFRLDVVLEKGVPRITEIEEIYGNVGKLHAMERAYNLQFSRLFENFAEQHIEQIYVDEKRELAKFGA